MDKILIVDDEIEVCTVLEEFLALREFEVYSAQDGRSAIEKVKEVKPHIVLLDIIMPGMGGIEVLQEIRKIDPDIGVIMITAVADQNLGNNALKLGAHDFITKPVDLNYLETVVMVKIIHIRG